MGILRKMAVGLLAALLGLTLLGFAWAQVGLATIHNKDAVKGWFSKSGFYDQVVDVALENANNSATADKALPLNDPAFQTVAREAFGKDFLSKNVDGVLDGSYAWLDGAAKDISFTIDLTSAKQQLANGVGSYIATKVAALPVCAAGMSGVNGFDGYTAVCRPSALNAAQAGDLARDDFLKQDFLKDPVISSATIKGKDASGHSVPVTEDERAVTTKKVYQKSGQSILALGGIAVLFILGIVFLSRDRLKGVRRVGIVFLSSGLLLLITYVGFGIVYSAANDKLATEPTSSPHSMHLALSVAKIVVNDIKTALLTSIIGFLAIGAVAIVLSIVLRKRNGGSAKPAAEQEAREEEPKEAEKANEAAPDAMPAEEAPVPVEKPAPRPPKKKLIQ